MRWVAATSYFLLIASVQPKMDTNGGICIPPSHLLRVAKCKCEAVLCDKAALVSLQWVQLWEPL